MSCVLRIDGTNLQVDALLQNIQLKPYAVYRKGEPRTIKRQAKGELHSSSGLKFDVSEADFDNLPQQIEDAVRFLAQHHTGLKEICQFPGVEFKCLDFSIEQRDVAVQYDRFPAQLLALLSSLGIDLEISHYDF